jgi:hypothetical protein
MGRRIAAVLLAVLLAACVPAYAAGPATPTVVVVLAPYMTWQDVTGGDMPHTRAFAEDASLGDMNIRSSSRYARELTPSHVALTMSAGAPAAWDASAPAAYGVSALHGSATASEVYRRTMGASVGSAEVVYLGLPRTIRANDIATLETIPGALGQAIVEAGGVTAAIGNSDGGVAGGDPVRSRPAALLAMDMYGLVRYGDVSLNMIEEDVTAPFGVRADIDRMTAEYQRVMRQPQVVNGPGLVVLDVGDAERAYRYAADVAPDVAEAQRKAALRTLDAVVGMALDGLPDDGVLMVLSSAQRRPASGPSGFGPALIGGPGFDAGVVSSASTHREGLMTELDVSATVLSLLGIDRPVSIRGNAVTGPGADETLETRVERLVAMNDTAVAVDSVRLPIQTGYIGVTVAVLLACAALLGRMRRSRGSWGGRLSAAFRHVIMLLLSMPLAATVMFVVTPRPDSPEAVVGLFALTSAFVWAIALLIERRWGSAIALAAVGLGSAGVLLADQLLGAPLSYSGLFSYSPLLGARYYGIGNEGASIVVGGALAGLALLADAKRDATWVRHLRAWGPAVAGFAIVLVTAAPFLGANVGLVAWGTASFGILWLGLNGRRMTPGWFLLGVAIAVAFVAAFSLYDLSSGAAQTHLGRAWQSADAGGLQELVRKAETNWRVLRATNWSILMVAILAFLGYMRWRPHGIFAETLTAYPAFGVAITAALWGSLVGYFTEDSGIVIPALVMLYITGSLLYLMLSSFVRSKVVT